MKIVGFALAAIGAVSVIVYSQFHSSDIASTGFDDDVASDASEFEAAMADSVHQNRRRRLNVRPVQFYAMADAPYSATEKENLPIQLAKLDPTVDFFVHLGDMQDRTPTCLPGPYAELAEMLKESPVATFILPGDNCYYDCKNWQEGWGYWKDAFLGLHENWVTKFNVRTQPHRPENFAITWHRVLFIGIHTLWSRTIKSGAHWREIENDDINWTNVQLRSFAHAGLVDAVVVLAHSYPRAELYKKYNSFLSQEATALGLPFLFLQGDAHRFKQDAPFAAKNILRTVVDRGGIADPIKVTVDLSQKNPFIFERRKLSGM